MIDLQAMTFEDAEQIREWRNLDLSTLRTPYELTESQQEEWYFNTVCSRSSNARWFSIYNEGRLIGYTGIENISWENRNGEISLLIERPSRGYGYGSEAVEKMLYIAYNRLNLNCVYGECYLNNPASEFWKELTKKHRGDIAILPARKFWDGKFFHSVYFSITKEQYESCLLYPSKRREQAVSGKK